MKYMAEQLEGIDFWGYIGVIKKVLIKVVMCSDWKQGDKIGLHKKIAMFRAGLDPFGEINN